MSRHTTHSFALLLLAGACALSACDRYGDREIKPDESTPTIERIEDSPDRFYGTRVTLTGEVDKVYSQRAFELENLDWVFDDEVLVLTRSPVHLGAQRLEDDKKISVGGTVHKLVVADVERDLGWDLEPELEASFRDKPVVVADFVEAIRSYARWSEKDKPKGEIVSLWALYAIPAPLDLENAEVELEAVDVAARAEDGLWVGFDGSADLFVVPGESVELPQVKPGDAVDVSGTLARLPEADDADRRWKLTDADKERLEHDAVYLEAKSIEVTQERASSAPATAPESKREG